ncbi:MAG: hypothetical protein WCQ86_06040 [Bacteroidaceae bacterium]
MKSHLLIYTLLFFASFGFSGCSSSDDLSTDGNSSAGRAVTFSAETSLSKKIAYGNANAGSIPIYWSVNDLITTYSPQSTSANKSAVYKADNGAVDHTLFSLNAGQTALTWNAGAASQSFCSFFPSTAATFSGAEGSIQATATLPSAQDGASITNAFMAGFKYTNVDPVNLQFAPLMNVLRLTITDAALNTDAAHTVSAIVIKSKETTPKKVAGTFKVGYPSSSVSSLSASSFTYDVSSATGDSVLITGSALSAVTSGALTVTAYLLPQNYGSLKITVYTNTNKSYLSKTAFSSTPFAQSSMFDLSFGNLNGLADVPAVYAKVDLGCPAGGSGTTPLYFAESNLVVEKTATGVKGYIAANSWYMAPTTAANYTSDAVGTKRDLFGWADITGWKTTTVASDYPSATLPANISGNPSYDIARALLGGNWRLPTKDELDWLSAYCTITWTNDYNGTGVKGLIVTGSSNTSVTYDHQNHSGVTLFLPALGNRSETLVTRSQWDCSYWGGTSSLGEAYYMVVDYDYLRFEMYDNIQVYSTLPYFGLGVRPVSE